MMSLATETLTPLESWEQEETSEDLPEFEDTHSPEPSEYAWGNEDYSTPNAHNPGPPLPDNINSLAYEDYEASASEFEVPGFQEIPEVEQSQDLCDSSASAQDNRPTSM